MANEPKLLSIPVPDLGLDTDSPPHSIKANKAPKLQNVLVDRPGILPMRGPINQTNEYGAIPAAGVRPVGIWAFNNNLLIGRRTQSATTVRDPWVAPYRKAAAEAELSVGASPSKFVNLDTGAVVDVTTGTGLLVPGPSWTRLGDFVYGISFAAVATNSVNVNGGFQWLTRVLRWDGTSTPPVSHTNSPYGGQAIKAHYRRLFVLGGRNPDGTGTIQPNTLWFSDPVAAAALPDTAVAWTDDTSGLVNQLTMLGDDNDFGVAMAKIGQNLAILRRRSIWILYGYSPSTFLLRPFTTDYGCIDPRSVVETNDGVYFMSSQGFMYFDGSQITDVSQNLRTSLTASALTAVGDSGTDGGRCVARQIHHGYIGVSVGDSSGVNAGVGSTTSFAAIYNYGRNAWVNITSGACIGNYPTGFGITQTKAFMYDDSRILNATQMTLPEAVPHTERGFDEVANPFRWIGTPLFDGVSNTLRNTVPVSMFPTVGTRTAIAARWQTALIAVNNAFQRAQLNRVGLDYTWKVSVPTAFREGWQVTVKDTHATQIHADRVPIQSEAPGVGDDAYIYRQRYVADCYSEASDVYFEVAVFGTVSYDPDFPAEASIQGLNLLFQPSHARRDDLV